MEACSCKAGGCRLAVREIFPKGGKESWFWLERKKGERDMRTGGGDFLLAGGTGAAEGIPGSFSMRGVILDGELERGGALERLV